MDDEMLKIIETTVPFAVPSTIMLMGFVIFANWSKVKAKYDIYLYVSLYACHVLGFIEIEQLKFDGTYNSPHRLFFSSKPMEMWLGVIAVCMALIQTFGIFFICGAQFNPVTSTMPFLVLAVGTLLQRTKKTD